MVDFCLGIGDVLTQGNGKLRYSILEIDDSSYPEGAIPVGIHITGTIHGGKGVGGSRDTHCQQEQKNQRKKKLSQIFHLHHRLLRYENIFFYFTTQ